MKHKISSDVNSRSAGPIRTGIMALVIAASAAASSASDTSAFRTPYKLGHLVLEKSKVPGSFDSKGVDGAFVFSVDGKFYMTYIGFDGIGYQTGLAESADLVHWKRDGLILARDPQSKYTRYNVALTSILRDDDISSSAPLKKVNGQYLATWHAYPKPGYEEGAALIGLAWSRDLRHWTLTEPVLRAEDGAAWEKGGLYKSYLVQDGDAYLLFYNAKNQTQWPWSEQTGVATSRDLKTWTRYSGNPIIANGPPGAWDELFASDPLVLRQDGTWAVYYYGLSKDFKARELLAWGGNPFRLSKVNEIMIDVGPKGSIDDRFAHKSTVISWHGDLYSFYTAASGHGEGEGSDVRGITVARSRPW